MTATATRRLLPLAAAAALVLPGCGSSPGASKDDPASAAPAGAVLAGSVVVKPEGDLKRNVEAAGRRITGGQPVGPALQGVVDKALSSEGLTYAKDVKPWLGKQIGFFVTSSGRHIAAAAVLDATDTGKAQAALDKVHRRHHATDHSYRGEHYAVGDDDTASGVIGDYVVAGSEDGVRAAVDAMKGDSLAESSNYKNAVAKLGDIGDAERLGTLYLDEPRVLDLLGQTSPNASLLVGQLGSLPIVRGLHPVAAAIRVEPRTIAVEAPLSGHNGPSLAAPKIAALGRDSWLGLAIPKLGDTVRAQLRGAGSSLALLEQGLKQATGLDLQQDIADWMGGMTVSASGTTMSSLNVAAVIDSRDPVASRRAIAKIGALLRRQRTSVSPVAGGFALHVGSLNRPIAFTARGDKVVIAYGKGAAATALHPSGRLDSTADYAAGRAALGGTRPSFLLSIPAIVRLIGGTQSGNAGFAQVRPYLERLGPLAGANIERNGHRLLRLALALR